MKGVAFGDDINGGDRGKSGDNVNALLKDAEGYSGSTRVLALCEDRTKDNEDKKIRVKETKTETAVNDNRMGLTPSPPSIHSEAASQAQDLTPIGGTIVGEPNFPMDVSEEFVPPSPPLEVAGRPVVIPLMRTSKMHISSALLI